MAPSTTVHERSCMDYAEDGSCLDSSSDFWWSSEGYSVRYAIVGIIFAAIVLLVFLSYVHAQRRVRKGLPPLPYHRWLVARRQYRQYPQNSYAYYNQPGGVPMQPMGPQQGQYGGAQPQYVPPPPAYGQWDAPPPVYQPPRGATKMDPEQNFGGGAVRTTEVGEGSTTQAERS